MAKVYPMLSVIPWEPTAPELPSHLHTIMWCTSVVGKSELNGGHFLIVFLAMISSLDIKKWPSGISFGYVILVLRFL